MVHDTNALVDYIMFSFCVPVTEAKIEATYVQLLKRFYEEVNVVVALEKIKWDT